MKSREANLEKTVWQVLVVDDEPSVHQMLNLLLDDFSFQNRSLQLHHANSAAKAKQVSEQINDLAVILLDVVMEEQDAGLNFVRFLREDMRNHAVRVILLTGQPGIAPPWEVVTRYEINDYRLKTGLTRDSLFITLATALRDYAHLASLSELATHDPLTGLANHALFDILLDQAIHRVHRDQKIGALLLLDLDYFKQVNDNHGHLIGDYLLKEVAFRLSQLIRSGEVIARIGGDELAIVTTSLENHDGIRSIIDRLFMAMSEPFRIADTVIEQSISLGISYFSGGSSNAETIFTEADKALYTAKRSGRNTYCIYEEQGTR